MDGKTLLAYISAGGATEGYAQIARAWAEALVAKLSAPA